MTFKNKLEPSERCIALIKQLEGAGEKGKEFKAYICPAGKLTIGYGHVLSESDCKKLFMQSMQRVKNNVLSGVPNSVSPEVAENLLVDDASSVAKRLLPLLEVMTNQNQFDALVSFVYNIGIGNTEEDVRRGEPQRGFRWSTLRKLHNEGKFSEAALQFQRWNKAGGKVLLGLSKRRDAERDLYVQKP